MLWTVSEIIMDLEIMSTLKCFWWKFPNNEISATEYRRNKVNGLLKKTTESKDMAKSRKHTRKQQKAALFYPGRDSDPVLLLHYQSYYHYTTLVSKLATVSDKVYQLLAHGRWFSPTSSTTKTGHCVIAEILLSWKWR